MVATKVRYHSRFFVQIGHLILIKCFENFDFKNTFFPKCALFLFLSSYVKCVRFDDDMMWFYAQVRQKNIE